MKPEDTQRGGGVGFVGLLTLLLIGLKLAGYIDWSWFLVLSPPVIWFVVAVLVLFVVAVRKARRMP